MIAQLARDEGVPVPALQLLMYPATNFAGQTRSLTLFADGYFLTKRDMDWFREQVPGRRVGSRSPIRGCRRCWPTICPVCRPRWC